ncbi:MAG: alkyl/aryl-sulfatase [Pirellulales bacterium]|nr:alkyl/aryl-sulfatase [Pirellulales bacterium]
MTTSLKLLRLLACFSAVLVLALAAKAHAQLRSDTPRLVKVNDRVYCATGYALGNVIYVITDDGIVVVDTSESPITAAATLKDFRAISDRPIRYLIYTHFHGDHCNGARAFMADKPKIIAQRLHAPEMDEYRRMIGYNRRLNALQFGASLPENQRGIAVAREATQVVVGYQPPTITFDDEYRFALGGIDFEIHHAPGETNDQSFVWLPGLKTLLPADLFYASFPMLASPMKPNRPILTWAESDERMAKLGAEHLVPSHGEPLHGADNIRETLTNYAAAIRHVHDATVAGLNRGTPLEEIRRGVRLPERLAKLSYLQPLYGQVAWGVNGVYRGYTGWYDMQPAHLNPGPARELAQALVEAAGGVDKIVARASQAREAKNWQLVVELTDVTLVVDENHAASHELRAAALEQLAAASPNGVERNIYRAAAHDSRQKVGVAEKQASK